MKSVCICCRGKSLRYIKNVPKVDSYILVNEFLGELDIDGMKETLQNSDVFHIFNKWNYMNVIPRMKKNNFYTDFDVKKIISPYVKEVSPAGRYSIIGRGGEIPFEWYPEKLKPYMWYGENQKYKWDFPSAGNGAALYGAYHATDEIHIIGMDLYEDLTNCYASGVEIPSSGGHDGEIMKKFLIEQTFLKFPNKKFYIYVISDFTCDLENVSVIRVNNDDLQWWES